MPIESKGIKNTIFLLLYMCLLYKDNVDKYRKLKSLINTDII